MIDAVGDCDYDHNNRLKKTMMHEEYKSQLDEAQRLNVPISMCTARVPLKPKMKQRAELTPDPFHHGGVYLGASDPSRSHAPDNDPTHSGKQASQLGFNRNNVALDGLHMTEEVVRQLKADEKAKAAEFSLAVERDKFQQPVQARLLQP